MRIVPPTRLRKAVPCIACVLLAGQAGHALAAIDSLADRYIDRRVATEPSTPESRERALAGGTPDPGDNSVSIGLAYQRAAGANTVTTPYGLDLSFNDWDFIVTGDGYSHTSGAGQGVDGFADVGVTASWTHKFETHWAGGASFTLNAPTGGSVGSARASEGVKVKVAYLPTKEVSIIVGGQLGRDEEAQAGVAEYSSFVLARMQYMPDHWRTIALGASMGHAAGAGQVTAVNAEYDFPIAPRMGLGGAFTATHTLAAGHSSNGVEFDLNFTF